MTGTRLTALLVVVAVVVAGWVGLRVIRASIGRIAKRWIGRNVERLQHRAFVSKLRELVFSDPFRFMNMLCSKEAEWFVKGLWKQVGDEVARVRTEGTAAEGDIGSHPLRLSDEGLGVERVRLDNGNVLAVVTMPRPEEMGEAFLMGVALPPDERLKEDVARARKLVRFFVVNRWEGERATDFCQWRVDGKELTYNVGTPTDTNGFAVAVQGKMEDEARRIGRRSISRRN
jgi:hypothetical protein